jgi:hypothetical protein
MRINSAAVGRRPDVDTATPGRPASALLAMSAALRPDRFDMTAARRPRVLLFRLRLGDLNRLLALMLTLAVMFRPGSLVGRVTRRKYRSRIIMYSEGKCVSGAPFFRRNALTNDVFDPR